MPRCNTMNTSKTACRYWIYFKCTQTSVMFVSADVEFKKCVRINSEKEF